MYNPYEDEVKYFQKFIPGATLEQVRAFHNCMESDAFYKGALPYSILSMLVLHFSLPKKLGQTKSIITLGLGITAGVIGKALFMPVCRIKAFGFPDYDSTFDKERDQPAIRPGYNNTFDAEYNQSDYGVSADKLLDPESEWKDFDSWSDGHRNTFDANINYSQEDETNVQRETAEKRVTYEDLWRKYRYEEPQGQNRALSGPGLMSKVRPRLSNQQKMREDFESFEAEFQEKSNRG